MAQADPPHKRAMTCYSYDSYADDAFNLVIKDDVQAFTDFKNFDGFVIPTPTKEHPLFGHRLPKKKRFYLSTDGSRMFMKSLTEGVQETMLLGQCFGKYGASKIFATHSGKAKFKETEVFSPTPNMKRLVYYCTWQFIQEQYEPNELPEDVNHLIMLMRDKKEKELLFNIHPSLTIGIDRGWEFLRMYEYVMFKGNRSVRDMILRRLPYLSNWRQTVFLCEVLRESYEHPNANYYQLAGNATAVEKLVHEGEMFMEFVRNAIAHRLERTSVVIPSDHQRVLDAFFPRLSPVLQEAIYDVIGKLKFQEIFLRKEQL